MTISSDLNWYLFLQRSGKRWGRRGTYHPNCEGAMRTQLWFSVLAFEPFWPRIHISVTSLAYFLHLCSLCVYDHSTPYMYLQVHTVVALELLLQNLRKLCHPTACWGPLECNKFVLRRSSVQKSRWGAPSRIRPEHPSHTRLFNAFGPLADPGPEFWRRGAHCRSANIPKWGLGQSSQWGRKRQIPW